MAFGTLFTKSDNPRSTAIKAVAKANGLDLKIVEVEFEETRTAEHLKASPLGKIPAFAGEDGFQLSEAIAIAIYITSQNEKTTLLGKTKQDYASILRWMSYFNTEIIDPLSQQYLPLLGRTAYDKKAIDAAAAVSKKSTNALEAYLRDTTFLVGERITLADIFAAGIITRGFQFFYGKEWRQENPNITRWFELIINQPIFSAVAEKLEFLETPKLTNVKPAAPKPAAAPKAAPKAAAAAAEEPAAEEPKAKHPCEALGRPTFPLDEWKRQYSNNETPEAMKYFWEKVPTSEYSIWRVDYKYNDELTLTFMSNNLIGGFNARLEGSRKYLFGCASVYGESNDSVIQGAFVIRGEEYLPVFDVAPDYESYSFTKLDASKPEDREFVEAQWGWDKPVTVNGKEYAHAAGKVFK
ncbi:Putative Elongation factor 1-gamma 2 [[Torrubiella] hemipterigena]|uniref:Putative Elongation factor 1-gamma 2 n=1 Tax=[Torrubiella] hemipterigena TaxID=1531966 RepID=A0A0A1SLV9_9HYPO|nr:Putative Elongation factor 1-gamma 2 [[Torrubiella] hemipterigena]